MLTTGWVSCGTGREELVAATEEQIQELVAGSLMCPTCAKACSPTFRPEVFRSDMQVVSWRDGRWQTGFVLA